MRLLAVDYGTARVGIAISDELGMFARPYKLLPASEKLPEEIAAIVRENAVGEVVVGMPYGLDGGESGTTRKVKAFLRDLQAALPCSVVEWDESHSSRTAVERMVTAGVGKKRRRQKGTTDTWAAAVILQEYLDAKNISR
jgi:putative Holliday junction resolvase